MVQVRTNVSGMVIKIISPARAVWANDDGSIVRLSMPSPPFKVEGVEIGYELSDGLVDQGIIGGEIWVEGTSEGLTVEARFWSPKASAAETKAALVAEVMAQWADGVGESGFALKAPGGDVLVLPCDDASKASVFESDDGRQVAPPSSVAVLARRGMVEEVRSALAQGDDVNGSLQGYSALHLAILSGHVDVARVLLDGGSDVNRRGREGETTLELLALANQLDDDQSADLAGRLLAKGATLDVLAGSTVLRYALGRGKAKLADLLGARGVTRG